MNQRTKKRVKKTLLYLICISICIIMLFPLLWGIASSFRADEELFKYAMPLSWRTFIPQNFTSNAYVRIFTEFDFGRAIANTLIVTLITILLGLIINSMAAFAFACFEFPLKKVLFVIVLMTFMIPFEAIALPL